MPGEPTVIYHAASAQQAYLLKGLIEEAGIAAHVVNDNLQVAGGELPLGWTAAARVVVASSDAERARQIAEQFDQRTAHEPLEEEFIPPPKEANWEDWPKCPECQALRQARCPICHTSGVDFPLADAGEAGQSERVLLMCKTCDDHFIPEFYRLCHQCGHEFGGGIDLAQELQTHELTTSRAWILFGGLALAAAAIFGYFYWLTR